DQTRSTSESDTSSHSSNLEPLEQCPRHITNDHHDWSPEPRRVDNAATPIHRTYDVSRDTAGRCPERPSFVQAGSHRRVDETGLDCNDPDAAAGVFLGEAFQQPLQAALGRPINKIARATAVACRRPNHDNGAALFRRAV